MVAKLWYLKKIDLLDRLPDEEIEKLSEMTSMEEVSESQPIYFPGERSDMIYLLKKGRVKISRRTPDGQKITVALLGPGEIFGELSLTDEQQRDTVAETVEKSLVCAVSRDQFQEFLADNPELAFNLTKLMGDRRREIESKIESLIFKDAPASLAHILYDLFDNHSTENGDEDSRPRISFSHQEIADLAGLTRPTTTNLLNEFQEEGLIELGRRKIYLEDATALKRRSRDDS